MQFSISPLPLIHSEVAPIFHLHTGFVVRVPCPHTGLGYLNDAVDLEGFEPTIVRLKAGCSDSSELQILE